MAGQIEEAQIMGGPAEFSQEISPFSRAGFHARNIQNRQG
jgi:hypothetical protein